MGNEMENCYNPPFSQQNQEQQNNHNISDKAKIDSLQEREKVYLGDKIQVVCLLQVAEIERLTAKVKYYQAMSSELKKSNPDAQIKEFGAILLNQNEKIANNSAQLSDSRIQQKKRAQEFKNLAPENGNRNLNLAQLQTQVHNLRIKNNKLIIQNEQINKLLQKERKQKVQLQAKVLDIKTLLLGANHSDSEKFKNYQQSILQKDTTIKRLRKKLKERHMQIQSLNCELQESQTNQYIALQQNQQLIFQLSKLGLKEESIKGKSQILQQYLKISELLSKRRLQAQQSFKGRTPQNSNVLIVPGSAMQIKYGSSKMRPASTRPTTQASQNQMQKNPFLQIIETLPMNSFAAKGKVSNHIKTQQSYNSDTSKLVNPQLPLNLPSMKNSIQVTQLHFKDSNEFAPSNNSMNGRQMYNFEYTNNNNNNLEGPLANKPSNKQTNKIIVTLPARSYQYVQKK